MSYSENLCEKALKLILTDGIHVFRNYRPDWLKNPETGRNLEIDFYIPKLQIAIEIQGEHHYDNPKQIDRDLIKKKILESFNVYLMAISITQISPARLYKSIKKHCFMNDKTLYLKNFNRDWNDLLEYKEYKISMNNQYKGSKCLKSPEFHSIKEEKNNQYQEMFDKIIKKEFYDYRMRGNKVRIIPLEKDKSNVICRVAGTNEMITVKMNKLFK